MTWVRDNAPTPHSKPKGATTPMPAPNIVLIVADDMGYGDFGKFNDGHVRTPVLDSLIEQSVCLTQHYSGSAVCAPARASLMTGRYPHRLGARRPRADRRAKSEPM